MSHTYKKILVAVDGSKEGEWALLKAIEICKRNDAVLTIAHIIDTRSFATMEAYDVTMTEQAELHANKLLEEYVGIAKQNGIPSAIPLLEFGSPKHKISKDIATEHGIDLIICGATGLNAIERMLMGSVSENIVRHAACDVLVVRTEKA